MLRWRCIDRVELRASANGSSAGAATSEAAACDLLVAGLPVSTAEMARGVVYVSRGPGWAAGMSLARRVREHAAAAHPLNAPRSAPLAPWRGCLAQTYPNSW